MPTYLQECALAAAEGIRRVSMFKISKLCKHNFGKLTFTLIQKTMSRIQSFLRRTPSDPIEAEMRASSTFEVAKWARGAQKGSFKQVAAELELERRNFWREFFTKSIVAWIALAISLTSLVITLIA